MTRWYVAQTQPRAEERARVNLERQGFTTYLPRYRRAVNHARRRSTVFAPLFPGYIFVHLDLLGAPWRAINGTFGVSHIVCHADIPAPLPDGIVQVIREREDDDGCVIVNPPSFRTGQSVRIVSGALADCLGLFERMADRDRVILLLDLLGRRVRVEAPLQAVAASG